MWTVGVTAASVFDLSIEEEVFEGCDVEFRSMDIESTDDLIAAFSNVDAIIDRLLSAPYDRAVIDSLENCQVIARCGIGVDSIATDRAAKRGMYVVNVPEYCQDEVSEHTILLMLAIQRNLCEYDAALESGSWDQSLDRVAIHRIDGQTLGLIGYGTIARRVAKKAQAFGMEVVASDPYVDADAMERDDVEKAPFETVLEVADVVSLHAPLVDETRDLIDESALARMSDYAYLINVARGGLVVEDALISALAEGEIAGAGLDVFRKEPASHGGNTATFDSRLRDLDNVVLTPHVAWFSEEADHERRRKAARDVRRVLEGDSPENPVNDPM